jgi:NADPH:quinone reductase-like Zn-dependent oxidoreductase
MLPAIPGRDVSGVIEAVGPDVTTFKAGDEVFSVCNGAYSETEHARGKTVLTVIG